MNARFITLHLLRVRYNAVKGQAYVFGQYDGKVYTFCWNCDENDYKKLIGVTYCPVAYKQLNPVKPQQGQYKHSPEFIEADYYLKSVEIMWGSLVDLNCK